MTISSYKLFFKAIANDTRFSIIQLLRKGPKSVKEICRALGFEQSRVSHNLKCLVDCGFVNCRQNGKSKIYYLDEKYILPLLENVEKHIKRYERRLKECKVIN